MMKKLMKMKARAFTLVEISISKTLNFLPKFSTLF